MYWGGIGFAAAAPGTAPPNRADDLPVKGEPLGAFTHRTARPLPPRAVISLTISDRGRPAISERQEAIAQAKESRQSSVNLTGTNVAGMPLGA